MTPNNFSSLTPRHQFYFSCLFAPQPRRQRALLRFCWAPCPAFAQKRKASARSAASGDDSFRFARFASSSVRFGIAWLRHAKPTQMPRALAERSLASSALCRRQGARRSAATQWQGQQKKKRGANREASPLLPHSVLFCDKEEEANRGNTESSQALALPRFWHGLALRSKKRHAKEEEARSAQSLGGARPEEARQGNDSIFVDYDFGDCSAFVARSCILDTCRASRHGCNATSSRTQCLGSLWCIAALFGWFEIVVERTRFA